MNGCNDRGDCVDGFCACHAGFSGADCSLPLSGRPTKRPFIYVYELPPRFNVYHEQAGVSVFPPRGSRIPR